MNSQRLLDKLAHYPVRPGWFTKVVRDLANDLRSILLTGSAVLSGGVVTGGTISATALGVSATASNLKLGGKLKAQLAALSNVDLFTTAGNVARATFENGSDASGISLATDETAHVTIVAVDSNGSGGATGDNGAPLYLAVVAGVGGAGKTYQNQTQPLTNQQIRAAIMAATGVHSGTTGFVRLADVLWDENGDSPEATVTLNRDA